MELTNLGEQKVEDGTLEQTLRQALCVDEDFPIFIPATTYRKSGKSITICMMEGYAFVATGLPETVYFALEKRAFVASVMSTFTGPHKIRTLQVLPNREVAALQQKLREMVAADIETNAAVRVINGRYKGLNGRVLGLESTDAYVEFKLRSLWRITTIPLVFLETVDP